MKRLTLSTVCAALLVAVPAMAQVPDAHRPPQDSATVGDTTNLKEIAEDSLIESDATALASMQMAMHAQAQFASRASQQASTETARKLASKIAEDSRQSLHNLNQLARSLGEREMTLNANGNGNMNGRTPAMYEDVMEYGQGRFVRDTTPRFRKNAQGQYAPDTVGFWYYEATPGLVTPPPAGVDTVGFVLYREDVYRRGQNGQYTRDTTQLYRYNGRNNPSMGKRDTTRMGMARHDSAWRGHMNDTARYGRMNDTTRHGRMQRGMRNDTIPNPPALGLRGALDWNQLQGTSGAAFDKAFAHQEVQGLQALADNMRNDIQPRLRNPELKDIADDILTNVGVQLRQARDAEVALKGK